MRLAVALLLLLAGAATGVVSVAVHGRVVGLLLALAATALAATALPGGWGTRFAFVLGWVAVVAYATQPRAEGDYVIGADPSGYLLLGFTLVLLIAALVTVRPLRPPAGEDS